MIVLVLSKPHFEDIGVSNLQYEIRISQKIHNKITITTSSYFDLLPLLSISRNP